MKKSFTLKRIFFGTVTLGVIAFMIVIFGDIFYRTNFRSTTGPLKSQEQVDLRGLRELQASGSAYIRFSDLKRDLASVKKPIIIIDGMAEYHGYLKGYPSIFFGYQRRRPNFKQIIRRLIFTGTTDYHKEMVTPEEVVAKNLGYGYRKVHIGRLSIAPDEDIDKIVSLFEVLPKDAWLHFHCTHGKGRTTTLMVMLDTFRNAPQVALEDIVKRHHLLGSENLFDTEVWQNGTYSKERLEERKKFVQDFYAFMCQRKAGGNQKWSVWKAQQKLKESS